MMNDRTMVEDVLQGLDAGLSKYAGMIAQTENMELRDTLEKLRTEEEKSQFELFDIAKARQYHQPAPKAQEQEIEHVKRGLMQ